MTLMIDLTEQLEARLREEALRRGVQTAEYAKLLIEQGLTPRAGPSQNQSTLDLLDRWEQEDQTDDPAELARRASETEEIKRALNENRTSGRKPFP
jgi:hypothetical protein